MAQKPQNKLSTSNKAFRRRYLTWLRMTRYGANNFTRNAWLTTAATLVMAITLIIIFATVMAKGVLDATVSDLRQKLDIPIYLRGDTSSQAVNDLKSRLYANKNISRVTVVSRDQARQLIVKDLSANGSVDGLQSLADIDEATAFPVILNVGIRDFNNLDSVEKLVKTDPVFKQHLNPAIETTFRGDKLQAINTINGWAQTAQRVGVGMTIVFVGISMLIIFNTIRMAIFNRKEEIQMMKLIGADKSFIRGPFVVEAVMYGFIAALVAVAVCYFALYATEQKIASYGIKISPIKEELVIYSPLVLLLLILVGATIGIISSRLAVRRYLKV